VTLTSGLFLLRYLWMLRGSPLLQRRWVRILPHVNDTLLLVSGLAMALRLQQSPFTQTWLTAKLVALLAYILLGSIALKRGRTRRRRALAGCWRWGVSGISWRWR
jgi:uncharacterized membrane protein SirB2